MTWVKIDDRAMLHPKLRAVGPRGVTAWLCALSAAAGIETDGVLTDKDVYPHWSAFGGRQSLRTELHKLERAGLVHFQSGTEGEMAGEWITSAKNRRKKPIVFAIHDYIDYQFSGEQKAQRKRAARERQQRHRAKGRKPVSRRDGKGCHAPPDPDPEPDPNTITNKEADTTPTESGDPSPPSPSSNRATETPAGSKLQRGYGERWQALYGRPFRWTPAHLDALAEIEAKAAETPELVQPALDAFFADEGQQHFKHIPAGLLMHWKRYTAGPKQRLDVQQRHIENAQRDLRYYQDLARAGDRPAPMSLTELEPCYLEDMQGKYPGLDLSQVRSRPRAVPAKTEPKPEQCSNGTPGNVADDPELAKYLI